MSIGRDVSGVIVYMARDMASATTFLGPAKYSKVKSYVARSSNPVSYTHLDVYKRQVVAPPSGTFVCTK